MIADSKPVVDPPAPRRLVSAREAGAMLGCSWRTIYRFADNGRIPYGVKIGSLRRWDLVDLEAFIAAGCKPIREPKKRP